MTGLDTGREYTLDEVDLVRSVTRDSLYQFVREFWHTITQETPRWNWHIEYLCGILQDATGRVERGEVRPYDLLCNISPGTTKSTIFSVMWRWNDFLLPLIVLSQNEFFTLQLALNSFQGELNTQWHYLLAMTVITLIPISVVFAFLQKYITTGIASAGVK